MSALDDSGLVFMVEQKVGMIWFFADYSGAKAFIYDFLIDEPFRRQGLGKQALLALEEKVKALNLNVLALHVFAHNTGARKLYEQLGYAVTNISMSKKLS
jgi:ribosomal protein S18 acetylase RimI-like enzyme